MIKSRSQELTDERTMRATKENMEEIDRLNRDNEKEKLTAEMNRQKSVISTVKPRRVREALRGVVWSHHEYGGGYTHTVILILELA